MARYAAFLADPDEQVVAPATVDQMCRPVVIRDEAWTEAHGLGFMLGRDGERILAGHSGGMPGFVTGLRVDRSTGIGAVVFANSTSGAKPMALAAELVGTLADAEPEPAPAWLPEQPLLAAEGLLGTWWQEGGELVFEVREGQLWSRVPGVATGDARYEQLDRDRWRIVEGREQGELLEVLRDETGRPVRMYLATYAVTRDARGFSELLERGSGRR